MVVGLVLGSLVVLLAVGGCALAQPTTPVLQRYSYSRMQMGVQCRITLYAAGEAEARAAAVLAFDEINRLEEIMSDYRPKSELSRLSDLAGRHEGVLVGPDLAEVLRAARTLSERTGGAFDPTVGAASRLWRETRRVGRLPEPDVLSAALATVGWRSLSIDRDDRVTLTLPGTRLDLGGIAKGYAAQRAVDLLARAGTPISMVALAGDAAVGDPPPGEDGVGGGWRVAVESGREGGASAHIVLRNAAVSTSGDAAQFAEIGGVRYAHILDPRTGLGSGGQRSATVVARSRDGLSAGARADALSTACFLTCDDPEAFARRFAVAVFIVDADGVRSADPFGLVVGH